MEITLTFSLISLFVFASAILWLSVVIAGIIVHFISKRERQKQESFQFYVGPERRTVDRQEDFLNTPIFSDFKTQKSQRQKISAQQSSTLNLE